MNYDQIVSFLERNGQELQLKLNVLNHRLESLFGFILIPRQKEKYPLLIKIILIVTNLLLGTILVELLEFSLLIIIMLYLSIEIESGSLFFKFSLLLLIYIHSDLLLGKNRYALLSKDIGKSWLFAPYMIWILLFSRINNNNYPF